jgi:uncharacterized protein
VSDTFILRGMGTRTSYAPGLFCWVDLQTTDVDGARAFYGDLFGWETSDSDPFARVGGESVTAILPFPPGSDIPPHFNHYVSVSDADAVIARVPELGGTVIEQPFAVGPAGRLALFTDPTGAPLCLWEPGEHIGAGRVNEPGCLTWNELNTRDADRAQRFYAELFGWTFDEPIDIGHGGDYRNLRNGERMNGAIRNQTTDEIDAGIEPHWLAYFVVGDAKAAAARASELGGRVQMPVLELPAGTRIAVLADPQDALFAVFEGETDD